MTFEDYAGDSAGIWWLTSHLLAAPVIFFESFEYHQAERLLEDHHGVLRRLNKSRKKVPIIIKAVGTVLLPHYGKKRHNISGNRPSYWSETVTQLFFFYASLSNCPVQEHILHPLFFKYQLVTESCIYRTFKAQRASQMTTQMFTRHLLDPARQ